MQKWIIAVFGAYTHISVLSGASGKIQEKYKDIFLLTFMVSLSHLFSGAVAYFDGLSETILSVGLVKPKAGEWLSNAALFSIQSLIHSIFLQSSYSEYLNLYTCLFTL